MYTISRAQLFDAVQLGMKAASRELLVGDAPLLSAEEAEALWDYAATTDYVTVGSFFPLPLYEHGGRACGCPVTAALHGNNAPGRLALGERGDNGWGITAREYAFARTFDAAVIDTTTLTLNVGTLEVIDS